MDIIAPTVCTVVVTYNRYALLKECLESLMAQSFLTDVMIVDNASTDDTPTRLEKDGFLAHPHIVYRRLETNQGGAGGFYEGCHHALKHDYDFVWLMDDDAEPALDALHHLVEAMHKTSFSYVAYAPQVRIGTPKTHTLSTFGHRGRFDYIHTLPAFQQPLPMESFEQDTSEIDMASFVGILVSTQAIKRIGLPKKEFFIHHDDTEYSLRLATLGKILLVNCSQIYHKEKRQEEKIERRFLRFSKNRIRFEMLWLKYFGLRNSIYTARTYAKSPRVWWDILVLYTTLVKDIVLYDDRKWLRLKFATHSVVDGLRGNFDNTKAKRLLHV